MSWYFQQALLREEGVAEDGYVLVNYFLGKHGVVVELDDLEKVNDKLIDGTCIKLVAEHFCYDDPSMHNYVAGSAIFSEESYRHRLRCHYGTKEEVLFKLQTYGIPTQDFPLNEKDELEFSWHREWIQLQRKKEADLSSNLYIIPRRFDVLFGRGRDTRVHTGNLRAKHLVESRFEEYENANKHEKTVIAEQVVSTIQESYGRFLKWEDNDKGWVEVDFNTARYKVAHFFRRRRTADVKADGTSNNTSDITS